MSDSDAADAPAENSPRLRIALSLLEGGQFEKAEAFLLRAARTAKDRADGGGTDSPEYAAALADLGALYRAADQPGLAADAYRSAVAGPRPTERDALRARLTHERELGGALALTGEWDEAERVLRENVEGCGALYGPEHPEYAFGQGALADVLLRRQGRAGEALRLAENAVLTLWAARHPRVAGALVLRAEAAKAAGRPGNAFAAMATRLSDEQLVEVARQATERAPEIPAGVRRAVLADLAATLDPRLGAMHDAVIDVLSLLANAEREMGADANQELRQDAIRRVVAARDERGERREAVAALLGLALAQSEAGQTGEASATYAEAVQRTQETLDLPLLSLALRNWGLHLAELGERGDAEERLELALMAAERTGDKDLTAETQTALDALKNLS
jgi:tetratricopeptide (TPR) repeat protein